MSDWVGASQEKVMEWLLESENPSVRYYTLRDLCDRPQAEAEVLRTYAAIMARGPVPSILKMLAAPDYRARRGKYYTDKYRGLVWQMVVLAELGAHSHPLISEQCEYLLENAQERAGGGFSQNTAQRSGGGRLSEVIPCLTGNMVWALIRFGYLEDSRVQNAIDWLATCMRYNDGVETEPQAPPYDRLEICFGKHTCHMAVVKTLKALAEIPAQLRGPHISAAIDRAVEFMLIHHIYRRSRNLKRMSKPTWRKFSFPLMYQTDILEILDILTGLGVRDPRMDDAVSVVLEKQNEHGRWINENSYANERLLVPLETLGQESKWLTLRALRVLKRLEWPPGRK